MPELADLYAATEPRPPTPRPSDDQLFMYTVRRRLAGYKVPRAVILLPALPRTPLGNLELVRVRSIAADAVR